jgi:Uma2 family endonuclease
MNMKTLPPTLTPDDLLAMPGGEHYELIDGIPKEKVMGAESDEISAAIITVLRNFARQHRLGHVYGSQTGFQCFPGKPNLVRIPDMSFVATGRLPGDRSPEGYIKISPDIAAEVISPHELYEEIEAKVAEYRSAGVKLIWVISPRLRTVLVRRLDGTSSELGETGTLSGEDVLPGFTCPVAELFV